MSELKPCPFCGSKATTRTGSDFTNSNYSVFCRNCFASTGVFLSDVEAISAWNTRTSDARIAELEAEVERLRAQSETMRNILQEADKRIVWEHHGLGHDFTDRVEDALND